MNNATNINPMLKVRWFPEIILFFIVIFFVIYRLFFGVDFSDNAYPIAICAHYIAGGIPFIDEYALHQTAAFIIYPFVKLYYGLFGFEGIILYTRFVGVLLVSICSISVAYFLRGIIPFYGTFFISLYILSARPQHDISFSYNFMVVFLSTISFFGFFRAVRDNSKILFCVAMFFLGLSFLSYPTCALIIPYYFFLGKNIFPSKPYVFTICSLLFIFLLVTGYFLFCYSSEINDYYSFIKICQKYLYGENYTSLLKEKVSTIIDIFKKTWVLLHLFFSVSAFFLFKIIKKNEIFLPFSILFLLLMCGIHTYNYPNVQDYNFVSYIAWLAPVYFLFLPKENNKLKLFHTIWIPALVLSFVYNFSTGGGGHNLSLGFYPASIVTLIYYIQICSNKRKIWISPLYGLILYLIYSQYIVIYRDEPFSQLNSYVQEGPYKGLFTAAEKKKYIEEVKEQLTIIEKKVDKPTSVLFAYSFSGGYLMSSLVPSTPTIWLFPQIPIEFYNQYFSAHHRTFPEVVFLMKRIPYGPSWHKPFSKGNTSINSFVEVNKYQKIYESENFEVYHRSIPM